MALDEVHGHLLVVDQFRRVARPRHGPGQLVARLPTCGDADDVFLDPERGARLRELR